MENANLPPRIGGRIGSLSRLIRQAAITAILDGTEKITKTSLDAITLGHLAERGVCGAGLVPGSRTEHDGEAADLPALSRAGFWRFVTAGLSQRRPGASWPASAAVGSRASRSMVREVMPSVS
jgi:hypothetical protein